MSRSPRTYLALFFAATFALSTSSAQAKFLGLDFLYWQRGVNRPNIVEYVLEENAESGNFDTLVAALSAVSADPTQPDLLTTLSNDGPFTVFAPTDDAFSDLGLTPENVGSALPIDALTDVLLYHVAAGRKGAIRLLFERDIEMLNGDDTEFRFRFFPFGFFINDSKVIDANNFAQNGVIHVIDQVLLPPENSGSAASAVPEPTAAMLLGSASVLLLRRSRRRSA